MKFRCAWVVVVLVSVTAPLTAANIVANPGFETGDFTGWIPGGDTSFTFISTTADFVHSGTYGAGFGPFFFDGTLSQSLATTAGQPYVLSFWLANLGDVPNHFSVAWDGQVLFSFLDAVSFPYQQHSYNVTASGPSTAIDFTFYDFPSFLALDDVSVDIPAAGNDPLATPEPATLGLLLGGLGMVGIGVLRRRK